MKQQKPKLHNGLADRPRKLGHHSKSKKEKVVSIDSKELFDAISSKENVSSDGSKEKASSDGSKDLFDAVSSTEKIPRVERKDKAIVIINKKKIVAASNKEKAKQRANELKEAPTQASKSLTGQSPPPLALRIPPPLASPVARASLPALPSPYSSSTGSPVKALPSPARNLANKPPTPKLTVASVPTRVAASVERTPEPPKPVEPLPVPAPVAPPAPTPEKYNRPEEQVEEQPYYHGLLPRDDVQSMLTQRGDYLVRTTEITSGSNRQYCLSVYWGGVTQHIILEPNEKGMYSFEHGSPTAMEFPTISGLISHHLKSRRAFGKENVILLCPVYLQEWELRHNQIELTKRLGEGAFGEVYAGVLTYSDENKVPVAVKQMKCNVLTKQKIEELMKEARMMRPLRHANVVRFYGVAAGAEPLLIIMELVNGGALDGYLKKNTVHIPVSERLNMCLDAALGIEYIHSKGIIHRDIASRNCLYSDSKCLKISDFGLSRKAEVVQLEPTEKAPVRWLAPEVFMTQTFKCPADVWAYGVLAWEIFTNGMEPYTGWSGQQIRDQIVNQNYRLPFPDWSPEDFNRMIINLVWTSSPEERMTAGAIARELERITNRPPPANSQPSHMNFIQRTRKALVSSESTSKTRESVEKLQKKRSSNCELLTNKKESKSRSKSTETLKAKDTSRSKLRDNDHGKKGQSKEALNKTRSSAKHRSKEKSKDNARARKSKDKKHREKDPSRHSHH